MNSDQTFVLLMTAVICFTVAFLGMVSAALGRHRKRGEQAQLDHEIADRLARMEQAVDAIAVEVERVSEGQRFVSKLMTERNAAPAAIPERVITPH